MTDDVKFMAMKMPEMIGVGKLGATVRKDFSDLGYLAAALDMAERRILRLEMALRRGGIEVEMTELPK